MADFDAWRKENDGYRAAYRDGIAAYIQRLNEEGFAKRDAFMPPDDYFGRIEEYRALYCKMLGLDQFSEEPLPSAMLTYLTEDDGADIYRLVWYVTAEIPMLGLLFVPKGVTKAPLVIAAHGNGGTPELCADLNGPNKYHHMVRRALGYGAVVFVPQLLLWNHKEEKPHQRMHPIPFDRHHIDKDLKRFGVSVTALEVRGIMRGITELLSLLPYVDEDRIGMVGHSYGGYYTLYTMAADKRIKAGYSNACFQDRNVYCGLDWGYWQAGNTFHDAEVAALCAPRGLFVTVGTEDELFHFSHAVKEAERARRYFKGAGCEARFAFRLWKGEHVFSEEEAGFSFLFDMLK